MPEVEVPSVVDSSDWVTSPKVLMLPRNEAIETTGCDDETVSAADPAILGVSSRLVDGTGTASSEVLELSLGSEVAVMKLSPITMVAAPVTDGLGKLEMSVLRDTTRSDTVIGLSFEKLAIDLEMLVLVGTEILMTVVPIGRT